MRWLAKCWATLSRLVSHTLVPLSARRDMCGGGADATPLFKRVEALLDLFQCNLPCHSNPPDDNTALILMHCVHSKRNGSRLGGCYQSKQLLAATFLVSMLAPSECARACCCVLWRSLPSPLTPPHLHRFPTHSPQATPAELAVLVAQVIILFDNLCQQVSTAIADQTWAPLR